MSDENASGVDSSHPQQPNSARAVVPTPVVIRSTPSFFSRLFAWMGWIGLLMCLPVLFGLLVAYGDYFDRTGGVQEKYHSLSKTAQDKIAVIKVAGAIIDGDGFVKRQIDRVMQDDSVKGVVLRVNSPGGAVSASDYIYHHLVKLREKRDIPLVVSMGDLAASGGYYVAMAVGDQEDSIFAEPTTTTGSIGVIIPHYDLTGLMERFDVKNDSIVSGKHKQLLSMTRSPSPEERQLLQRYVDAAFERFKKIVKSGRPAFREDPDALNKIATGQIFGAELAQENGLVDKIGFIEDAINRVIAMADLDESDVRVVTYNRPASLIEAVGLARADSVPTIPSMISDLQIQIPRAYYLMTF